METIYYSYRSSLLKKKKERNIFFDLDGVIRDLAREIFGEEPKEWQTKKDGKNIIEYIKENPYHLIYAKPTEYYETIKNFSETYQPLQIITSQPKEIMKYSLKWIENHFDKNIINFIIRVDHFYEKESLLTLFQNSILIEDYPFYENNLNQIVLIEREYNKKHQNKNYKKIVKTIDDLESVLSRYKI